MGKLIDIERYKAGLVSGRLKADYDKNAREMQREINRIVKKLDKLPKEFTKRRKKLLLNKAAKIFVASIRNFTPISDKPHKRYSDGKVQATYYPMNLYNSIQPMRFRKSDATFVGPKLTRKELTVYGGNEKTTQPYYAHMVEYGTKHSAPVGYMRKGWAQGKNLATFALVKGVERIIKQYEKKHSTNVRRS
jgi:HK97 gp10 family phage protein